MRFSKDFLLEFIAIVDLIIFFLSAAAVDSGSIVPMVICFITEAYMVLFIAANLPEGKHNGSRKEV